LSAVARARVIADIQMRFGRARPWRAIGVNRSVRIVSFSLKGGQLLMRARLRACKFIGEWCECATRGHSQHVGRRDTNASNGSMVP
jgi:hypothetical protein